MLFYRATQLLFALIFSGLIATSFAQSEDLYPFTSKAAAERFATLTQEVRCVVCQNQSLADSNAPLALDLRNKIYHMILDNQSDQAIKDYLVARYGQFILLQPRLNKETALLWFFPLIGLLAAFIFVRRALKLPGTKGNPTLLKIM